jgi:hypothetical protein
VVIHRGTEVAVVVPQGKRAVVFPLPEVLVIRLTFLLHKEIMALIGYIPEMLVVAVVVKALLAHRQLG